MTLYRHAEELAARLFFVEQELQQAHGTIRFLRDCVYSLEHPEYQPPSSHAYPEMTERHLHDIEALVGLRKACAHAHHGHPDCPACVESRARWEASQRHAKVLGWPTEPGRWPRPPETRDWRAR